MSLVRLNLLFMSVHGGILILAVLLLRRLLKDRLPKRTFTILWCVALLRLLTPFSVDAPFGVLPVLQDQMAVLQDYGLAGGENSLTGMFLEGLYSEDPPGYYKITASPDGRSAAGIGIISDGRNAAGTGGTSDNGSVAGAGRGSGGGNAVDAGKGFFGGNVVNAGKGSFGGNADSMDGYPYSGGVTGIFRRPADGVGSAGHGPGKQSLFRKIGTAGTVVCAAVFLALYLNCLRRFKTALPVEDLSVKQWLDRSGLLRKVRVRQSDRISSPLAYGLVRPVILLPKHLEREDGQELEFILQHELVHIRRFDGAWKLAMAAALCLHWFNPLVWVMYMFMNRDLELSCDEAVLRVFGVEARRGYALTLIGMEERRYLPVTQYSGFGKNAVEERIGEIMKYKKKTKPAVCAGAALILAVICMSATISKANEEPSGADEGLSEDIADTALPMDPPEGYFGETDSADGNAGSEAADRGAADGTDFNADTGAADGTDFHADARAAEGTEQPAGNITELPANGESGLRLTYIKEGSPESEPARLITGEGYHILLPEEGWTAFGPDGWMSEENNEVRLWVTCFSAEDSDYQDYDRERIIEALKEKCFQESENGWLYMEDSGGMTAVELRQTDEQDIWGIFYTYPGEAEDGWGVELRAMAQTFSFAGPELSEISPGEGEPEIPGEIKAQEDEIAEWLLQELMEAAGEEDHDSILPCIAEGYEVDAAELDRITEWKQEEINVRLHPTEERCVASMRVITKESEEDSNDYLTVELLKEGEDWKICFMGLEK